MKTKNIKACIVCVLSVLANASFAQGQYDFAIYYDDHGGNGAWEESIIAFEHFLDWKNISHNRVSAKDINNNPLKENYKVIYFPGGDCDYYDADINDDGKQHIRDMIADNGGYVGTCAGAEFACDKLVWEGVSYDHGLDLFEGIATGPIDELAHWPDYDMTTLTMNLKHPINEFETMYGYGPDKNKEDVLYYGGSVYTPYSGVEFDTVAIFDGYKNKPGIISFSYGKGRVLLISPHPEIEEDDSRDGVNTAEELNDRGSDWNFLWPATDWLLGKPITHSMVITGKDIAASGKLVNIYPNPSAGRITFVKSGEAPQSYQVSVKNIQGKEMLREEILFSHMYRLDLEELDNGIYFLEIQNKNEHLVKKIVLQR